MTRRVAIIGVAHRMPGTTPEDFWQDLRAEKDLVTQVAADRWSHEAFQHPDKRNPGTSVTFAAGSLGDISGFDADFFGISPREAANMDPQQRMLLELTWESMESAGIPPSQLRGSQCGVFLGVAALDYSYRYTGDMAAIDASTATGNTSSIASNRLSYLFDLHGPSMSVDTACSSSMVAFHQACQAIRAGETSMALAGGISLHLHPYGFVIFSKASMLSPSGRCRVFDADGDGYVRSEGAGMFLLKDYDQAVADGDTILAVVAGSTVNTDGHKQGLTVPNADAQVALMRQVYERAGIDPNEIDYLEAHGTGTAVGDPIETRAIGEALAKRRRSPLPIGSVKSNLGHLETASGIAGLAKALYSLRHREVPATIGIRRLNPKIQFDDWNLEVVTHARPLKPEGRLVIGVNSFGFGGANAHVILESPPETPAPASPPASDEPLPLQLSARGEPALRAMAGQLADWLRDTDTALYDVADTLYQRRDHHTDGALLFAADKQDAAERLAAFADPERNPGKRPVIQGRRLDAAQGPAFVYAGNGCQWETMGRDLLADSKVFAAAIDEVDALFQRHADFSLRAELEGDNGSERFVRTEIAQPALFALQVGITRMLAAQGIEPIAVTGHSVGEVAAAWACGALSLEDAVRVIYLRSHFQGLTRGQGEMTAVGLGAEAIAAYLERPEYRDIHLAGSNSAQGVTLAGPAEALTRLEAELSDQRHFAKRLPLDYAFHSPVMDPIRDDLITALAGLHPRQARIPYISTVTGEELNGERLDADYWWHNIRQPVRFDDAARTITADGTNVLVEIGAHPILKRYLSEALREAELDGLVIGTLERDVPGPVCLDRAIGQTLLSGLDTDIDHWFPVTGRLAELPRYPWQREPHWMPTTSEALGLLARHYEHPLLGYRLAQHTLTWESQLDTGRQPWLADHVVGDAAIFPGAGFIELALAAAARWREATPLDVEELEIQAPMMLDGQHGRLTRLAIAPDDGRVTIHSREPAVGVEWQLHATARIMAQSRGLLLERTAPALPERAPDLELDEHLAMASRLGLDYGPAFQAIDRAWVEGDSVIGRVRPTPVIEDQLALQHLHPGILDSAFQLFLPLLARDGLEARGMAFVPVRVGRIQWTPEAGRPILARARLLKRAPYSFTADFELFDEAGQAVAVVSETRFKAVRLTQSAEQSLSHLDVRLTPAPHPWNRQPADLTALEAAMPRLVDGYVEATGQRYASEVAPLLDRLAEAFAAEALDDELHDGVLGESRYQALAGTHPQARPLLDQLLRLLEDAGRLEHGENGWTRVAGDDEIDATTIWRLLAQDYPGHIGPIHRLGRFGLNLRDLLAGHRQAADIGLDRDRLTRLNRQLIGHDGWRAIATPLGEALADTLAHLSAGQRLTLLEAGVSAPALGERLADLIDPDRCDYRILTAGELAWQHAEQLRERQPLIEVESLEAPAEQPPQERSKQAQLALVSLDVTNRDLSRRLIEALPERLAPGARVLLLGVAPSAWLDTLLATPGLDDEQDTPTACELDDVTDLLARLGAEQIQSLPLEDEAGAYLVHARLPDTLDASEDVDEAPTDYLLVADGANRALAERLAADLKRRGHRAALGDASEAAQAEHIVDLRDTGLERCQQAARWASIVEASGEGRDDAPTLWLVTRDVAAIWGDASDPTSRPSAGVSDDTALWGFGRSLANEAQGFRVRLLDLPSGDLETGAFEALSDELTAPDDETEVAIDASGTRFATRLRILPAPGTSADAPETPRSAMTLGFPLPGQLRHLAWQPTALPEPGEGEVEVRVEATGLNFRDVMYTLGLLSDEAIENGFAGPTLGLEFAGVVERLGRGVEGVAPGDAVLGFGPASFSDRLIASQHAIAPLPDNIDFAAAATIPTTFFTVYYALKHLARLSPGEHVLIHGAAGGVGLAAIQVARWLGAEIHATVGAEEKGDFLRLSGIERLYDSRSLTFAEEILADTNGRGVDVVLNSLAGEAINQNLRVLRPFGRFLELGKRDFYENTHIGLRPFRNNLSYFGIDSDQLMKACPELTQSLFSEMMALFEDGTFTPLPYTAFGNRQVVEAFRYMQQARQIGKVVVTQDQPLRADVAQTSTLAAPELPADATYLVTGGLGGFGLRSAQWLAERGARHLVLVGRRGAASPEADEGIARLEAMGVTVEAAACDVADRDALAALLERCRAEHPPLKGIIHAAAVIEDGLIRNLDDERIARVLTPKIEGARHLDALTRNDELDFFVLYSSATTLFGNPGQASYVAANHWLEALAANRRAAGLPATCVRWGAIEDAGFLARNTRTRDALQERLGGSALRADDALEVLGRMLAAPGPSLGVLELDWSALARSLPTAETPRFSEIARAAGDEGQQDDADQDLARLLDELSPEELHATVTELLKSELASILLVEEDKIDVHRSVYDMGFDSLMGVELMTAIESRLGVRVPVMVLSEASTLDKLSGVLIERLARGDDEEADGDDDAELASLAARHGTETEVAQEVSAR
ncbi:type I polyketide synthase [Halomonas eurihalina]|uniref:Type I polyketide synthase n=1 Tax=Halomonas eurihalina TaxID=42566 RepID=A0A5D9DB42_HALER|nr:type I polyketide synthase [Halomonas eurihalina]MDR5858499.1 type I polyketide synthase [Halomonas eurihalina]TZG40693.1 type I polyketide synthase [Halomonas eurihalina]